MPHIICRDEFNHRWAVEKGDPGWDAADHAKKKLLLTEPYLPLSVFMSGQPDASLASVRQDMLDYLEMKAAMGTAEPLRNVWKKISIRFRAWRTQVGVFGAPEDASRASSANGDHSESSQLSLPMGTTSPPTGS
jgi:hypothetical protein